MVRTEHGNLLKRYQEYAISEAAIAVLFVKTHLRQAQGRWIEPVSFRRYEMSPDSLHFRFVVGQLYDRLQHPKYPPKADFTLNGVLDESRYLAVARAITWDVAHRDIEQQKSTGVVGVQFEVTGVSYDRNRGNKGFFREDAPPRNQSLSAESSGQNRPTVGPSVAVRQRA